jgi:hypothetical protein
LERQPFNESEMALFSEGMLECARKVLDTADIVREAISQQLQRIDANLQSYLPDDPVRSF